MVYIEGSAAFLTPLRVEAAFRCGGCQRATVGGTTSPPDFHMIAPSDAASAFKSLMRATDVYWEPVAPLGKSFPNVPDDIASAASEAFSCFSIGANRAAILLARSVVEASAKAKGIIDGPLISKIDKLAQQQHVRAIVAESAHEIRHIGNEMAHGDFATAMVGPDEADEILGLMEDILREVFETPTRLAIRKGKRIQRANA